MALTAEGDFLVQMVRSTTGGFGIGNRNWNIWQSGDAGGIFGPRDNPSIIQPGPHNFVWDINYVGEHDVIDFGAVSGHFGVAQGGNPQSFYPNGTTSGNLSQYSIRAYARVTFPAGDWTIGFGSDDGGYLKMDPDGGTWAGWTATGGQLNTGNIASASGLVAADVNGVGDSVIWFGNGRGHRWSGAQFTLASTQSFYLDCSSWEGGGGDSMELAVKSGHGGFDFRPNAGAPGSLLTDGVFGIIVAAPPSVLSYVVNGDDTVTITDCDTAASGTLAVPATIGGKPVTRIGDSAFGDCVNLTSIGLPDSVTSIGNNAFMNCTSLASITLPDSVTNIGDRAFAGCTELRRVHFEAALPTFGTGVFSGADQSFITYPGSLSTGGEKSIKVRLLFEPKLAVYITERQWHPSQEFHMRRDGRVEMRFETTGRKQVNLVPSNRNHVVTIYHKTPLATLSVI
jgi:hypothetical protein